MIFKRRLKGKNQARPGSLGDQERREMGLAARETAPPVLSRVTFIRGARAPASGHSTHFNPQHWFLCHMGLY